jgi:hypothetical protein
LIAGLVFDGVMHRKAIRTWLDWEVELAGPWSGRDSTKAAFGLLHGKRDELGRRDALRQFEENRAGSDRQLWRAIGIDPESSGPV